MVQRNLFKTKSVNSTYTPLSADGVWTGEWERSDYDQVAVSTLSDTDGVLWVEVGVPLPGGTIRPALIRSVPIYAGVPFTHALAKGAGRVFRTRFVNSSTPQSEFFITVSYGDNLTLSTSGPDNEVLTTVVERDRDRYVALQFIDVVASQYAALVDLSDTVNFPHDRVGSLNVTNAYFLIDKDANTQGSVRIGVITRINTISADIDYVSGVTFSKSDDRKIIRDRKFSPSALRCAVVGGALTDILTDFSEVGVTAVNTLTPLRSPLGAGTVTPGVGDLIVKAEQTAGSYNASVSIMYHSER